MEIEGLIIQKDDHFVDLKIFRWRTNVNMSRIMLYTEEKKYVQVLFQNIA
jgi:hypothetical protein